LPEIHKEPNYYSKYYPKGKLYLGKFNGLSKKFYSRVKVLSSKLRFKRVFKNIQKTKPQIVGLKYSLLDVGCGKGFFLSQIKCDNLDKYGIDINSEALESNLAKDATLFQGDFVKYDFNQKFDILTLFHALEHFPNPLDYINKAQTVLNQNGILAIIIPNINSLGFNISKKNWFHLDSPRHLFLPSKKALITSLEESNFEIISVTNPYYEYPFDLYHSMPNKLLKLLIIPFYLIIKSLSKETIFIIAKKK
jgi:2-polyprenyl-3-methyl-5-hydroxy-6-metoxy-1,4-benzoquinol methylase